MDVYFNNGLIGKTVPPRSIAPFQITVLIVISFFLDKEKVCQEIKVINRNSSEETSPRLTKPGH